MSCVRGVDSSSICETDGVICHPSAVALGPQRSCFEIEMRMRPWWWWWWWLASRYSLARRWVRASFYEEGSLCLARVVIVGRHWEAHVCVINTRFWSCVYREYHLKNINYNQRPQPLRGDASDNLANAKHLRLCVCAHKRQLRDLFLHLLRRPVRAQFRNLRLKTRILFFHRG